MSDLLQKMINKHLERQQELRSEEMFTLGKFINELEKYNKDFSVYIKPFHLTPTHFMSYRGYYADLALGYTLDDKMTVGELLQQAKECINKTFIGYKGGEFVMTENTPLWISNYGECSDMTIGSIECPYDGWVYMNCYKRED